MRRTIGPALLVGLLLTGVARAQEPTEEEKRAEAHRTIFRRFSEKAETAKLGLGEDATAVIDLLLDLERNRAAVRARQAPRSRYFMGTAHGVNEIRDGKLVCMSNFVMFTIDRAEVPLTKIPAMLEAALDGARFASVRTPGESERELNIRRRGLLLTLVRETGEVLAKTKDWESLRPRLAETFMEALDGNLNAALGGLRLVGDDAVAKSLIDRLDELCAGKNPYVRGMIVSAICRMPGKTARAFLLANLRSEDERTRCGALMGVPDEPDAEVMAIVTGCLAKDARPSTAVLRSVLSALERVKSDAARKAVREAFVREQNADAKYSLACSLTRMGDDGAIPWLETLLTELEGKSDAPSRMKASFVRSLLERRGK